MGYEQYYWPSSEEKEQEPVHSSEGGPPPEDLGDMEEKGSPQKPNLSPRSSSSGLLILYTPDSATSPNRQSSSPQLTSTPQSCKEENPGGRKVKTRTAFSQEQRERDPAPQVPEPKASQSTADPRTGCSPETHKQVKTWFQNQWMKFKQTQKETLWMRKGMCQAQNSYLDINSSYHEGYNIGEARNIHSLGAVHENFTSNQNYSNNQNYNSDHQVYGSPQNFYLVGENGSFGKAGGACYSPQAISYISHQKMSFYPGFPASMEYATMKMEDGYTFPNASSATRAFPGPSVLQHDQAPLQTQGPQSNCNS